MIEKERFVKGLSRCSILFENEKISSECIVKEAMDFFVSGLYETTTRRRTLLHTGSVAYDAAAAFLSALADVLVFYVKKDEFLSGLKPGDIVINTQDGKRLRREVTAVEFGESITLLENSRTNCRYTMPWSYTRYLEPNRGTGRKIGGAGLRQAGSKAREEFFEYAFGMKAEDVPRTPKSYTVVVASHEYARRIYRGLVIEAERDDGRQTRVNLSDIVGGIYVTPEQNISLGGPLSTDDSVMRFCSSLTLAKRKINEADGDGVASLLVISHDALLAGDAGVFDKLSSMKRKNFVFTSIAIGSPAVDRAIRAIKNVEDCHNLLSHTKHYLRKFGTIQKTATGIVGEIWSQVCSLASKKIFTKKVEGFLSAEEYGEWLAALKAFKFIPFEGAVKAAFLEDAYGLFSFLRGSVFEMSDLDAHTDLVWKGRNLSPSAWISGLKVLSSKYPDEIKALSDKIISILQTVYDRLKLENNKLIVLEHILSEYKGRHIAVIVPQEGFKVLFEELGYCRRIRSFGGALAVSTPNSFGRGSSKENQVRYDVVVSLGGTDGRRFSPFACSHANEVCVVLYAVEAKRFLEREKDSIRKEKVLNSQSTYSDYTSLSEGLRSKAFADESQFESELSDFLKEFRAKEDQRLAERYGRLPGINRNVEVVKIGTLDSGEKIFFTRFFRPYIMDEGEGELKEVEIGEIAVGDTLLFMQNNDASKDIVDVMLKDHIATQTPHSRMAADLAKTQRWRQLLREFAISRKLSAVDIAERMKATGSTVHEVTVRNWMDEESHLVGPRNKSSLEHIAKLTGDVDLRDHIDDYFTACKNIRERRVKLLHELGAQIRGGLTPDKLADKENVGIVEKVRDMVKLCVLENVTDAPEGLHMNTLYVNRPILSDMKAGE